jgi:hypothetical protein
VAAVPPVPPSDTFAGWILNGPNVSNYSIVHDQDVKKSGAASARITCVIGDTGSFGGMMQSIKAASYRGKRVRFSALVRTVDVVGWVGLWMRVDRSSQPSSAFDNMQDRGIRGTTEWTRHDVVLDVADDAESLHYGLLHAGGPGSTWLDGASLEIVDKKIDVTGKNMHPSPSARPMQPSNLDLDG